MSLSLKRNYLRGNLPYLPIIVLDCDAFIDGNDVKGEGQVWGSGQSQYPGDRGGGARAGLSADQGGSLAT